MPWVEVPRGSASESGSSAWDMVVSADAALALRESRVVAMHPRWVALIWPLGNGFSGTPVGSDASFRAGVCGVTRSDEPANRRSSRWPWDVRPERAAVVTRSGVPCARTRTRWVRASHEYAVGAAVRPEHIGQAARPPAEWPVTGLARGRWVPRRCQRGSVTEASAARLVARRWVRLAWVAEMGSSSEGRNHGR